MRGSILLTVAEYDPAMDHPIQTFQVPYPIRALGIATHNVVAKVNGNWGSQYTCVYRVSLTFNIRHRETRTDFKGRCLLRHRSECTGSWPREAAARSENKSHMRTGQIYLARLRQRGFRTLKTHTTRLETPLRHITTDRDSGFGFFFFRF